MGRLFNRIRRLAAQGRYAVGDHACDMLEARGIIEWQAVAGLLDGKLLNERPNSRPNPSVEVDQTLPDGTAYKAVWSHLPINNAAKRVTVHFYDRRRP